MSRLHREAVVPYSCRQIYTLINDINLYKNFLPWCEESKIEKENEDGSVLATLEVRHKGIRVSFTTLNRSVEDESIVMRLVEGPFKHLQGVWKLNALGEERCKVSLDFDYRFSNLIYDKLLNPIFVRVVASLVKAFLNRAREIYG